MRDDIESASAHAYDWICHFNDGVSVDTASGWVQGIGKSGQSLGVRVLAPASWTATTGTQTAQQMNQFDPDAQVSWVRVRPASNTASAQSLTDTAAHGCSHAGTAGAWLGALALAGLAERRRRGRTGT